MRWPWRQGSARSSLERSASTAQLQWLDRDPIETLACLWRLSVSGQDVTAAVPIEDAQIMQHWLDCWQWLLETLPANNRTELPNVSLAMEANIATLVFRFGYAKLPKFQAIPTHDSVTDAMKDWVLRTLVQKGVCPFTKSVNYSGQGVAGVPVARIAYHTSNATAIPSLMADTLSAIQDMLQAGPERISSILLAAPHFDDDFPLWAGPVFCLLETSVVIAEATDRIGVVCFHNQYQTPDGTTFSGFGHMHSVPRLMEWCQLDWTSAAAGGAWQRQTPHATINVLRADQLALAEGLRNTPELYASNIRKYLELNATK